MNREERTWWDTRKETSLKNCWPERKEAAQLVCAAFPFEPLMRQSSDNRLALRKIRQLRRFLTVIKELIEWALESASQLFQRFDGRDSMTILYA